MQKDNSPSKKAVSTPEVKEVGPDQILSLNFTWTEIEPHYQKAVTAAAKGLKLPGFRPGKVPPQIAESKIDPEKLAQKTLQKLLPTTYEKQITAEKLNPIIQPEFVLTAAEKGKDWTVEAHFAIKPEIKLGDYQKIIKKAKAEAKKEIEAKEAEKSTAAKKAHEEAKKALTKKEAGAKADVVEMDPTLTALTPKQIDDQALDRAILALRTEIKPVIAEVLVKKQAQAQLQELLNQLKQFNIELDDYLHNTGNTFEQLADTLTQDALHRLQLDFLMQALIEAEKITASDEEIHTEFVKLFQEQNSPQHHHEDGEECHCEEEPEKDFSEIIAVREQDPYYKNYVADLVKRRKLITVLENLK